MISATDIEKVPALIDYNDLTLSRPSYLRKDSFDVQDTIDGSNPNKSWEEDAPSFSSGVPRAQIFIEWGASGDDPQIQNRFKELANQWRKGTMFCSSVHQMSSHPAYQQIIGMGETVIRYILRDLERSHQHWFVALNAITGENPVKDENRGNVDKMSEAWVNWGRLTGYL